MLSLRGDEGPPAALQERPPAPEDHRRRQHQLGPAGGARAHPGLHRQPEHRPHGDDEERHGQRRADDKAAAEVDKLRVRPLMDIRHALRLQRHAADRAGAGADLLDLGMHRAGVDRARRRRRRRRSRPRPRVPPGIGLELRLAAGRAEMDRRAVVHRLVARGGRIHRHAADGVADRRCLVLRVHHHLRVPGWIQAVAPRVERAGLRRCRRPCSPPPAAAPPPRRGSGWRGTPSPGRWRRRPRAARARGSARHRCGTRP